MTHAEVGQKVRFAKHVFGENSDHYPHYEMYVGCVFEITGFPHAGHANLRPVDAMVVVPGCVHLFDLEPV